MFLKKLFSPLHSFSRYSKLHSFIEAHPIIPRVFRLVRFTFIGYGLYQLGYSNGILDFAKSPETFQNSLVESFTSSSGLIPSTSLSPEHQERVQSVSFKIVKSAQLLCQLKHQETEDDTKISKFEKENCLSHWSDASARLKGEWKYFIVNSPEPNAFVTEMCPRRIFIHSGLLEKCNLTDDELAMVLGHEISHLIYEHGTSQTFVQTLLKIIQLILLSFVDPIGLESILFDYIIHKCNQLLIASYSRQEESEADELGIQIATLACFDPIKGAEFFQKLSNLSTLRSSTPSSSTPLTPSSSSTPSEKKARIFNWNHTHPDPIDRYKNLMSLSSAELEKQKTYTQCQQIKQTYKLFGGKWW